MELKPRAFAAKMASASVDYR